MFELKSDHIITPKGKQPGIIIIDRGKIVDVLDSDPGESIPVVDLRDKILMPGVVDPHVHINEPGRTEWEGFDTATRAAVAGGVTSLVEMPLNSSPVTTSFDSYHVKIAAANKRIHCHCGFWGGVVPGNEKEIHPMITAGVRGFKAFLVHSGIDEFPAVNEEDLRKVMPILAAHQLPLLVHCELESPVGQLPGGNKTSYERYLASRPAYWEDNAISLMIKLCGEFRCPVHIVHLSSANSLAQIRKAKDQGLPLTVETTQHYLYFAAENIKEGETQFKCAPPIRSRENNKRLLEALRTGLIDFVATDHSPALPSLKQIDTGDFEVAWGGIASLQFSLPALWTVMKKNGESLENLAKWLCEKPSLLPALENKGRLVKGADADILVFDPAGSFEVKEEMILHRHKITPYLGEKLDGLVEQVYLAGEKIYEQGNFLHLNRGTIL